MFCDVKADYLFYDVKADYVCVREFVSNSAPLCTYPLLSLTFGKYCIC